VPLIFRVPGVTRPGTTSDALASQTSLMATLLELCGIPVPAGLDGPSLVPFLREPGRREDAPVFAEFALRTRNAKYMIRHRDWKYCHYVNDSPELYDLKEDPKEMHNLAGDSRHGEKVKEMKQRLFSWHTPQEQPA
jgi:arylsulfatase A-like enzyme